MEKYPNSDSYLPLSELCKHTHTDTHAHTHTHRHAHRDTQNLIQGGIVFTSVDESAALVLCDKKRSDKNARRKNKTKKQVKGAR